MARFRIETVLDPASGLYYNEAYYPEDAAVPFGVTKPIYRSIAEAESAAVEILKKAMPDQPVQVVGRSA